jgi:chitinase
VAGQAAYSAGIVQGGGGVSPSLVAQSWNSFNGQLKGLMTWSINWDGSKNWTFGDNVKSLQGR